MIKDPVQARKWLYIVTTLFGAAISYLLFKQVIDEKTANAWASVFNVVAGALITGGPATATFMLTKQINTGASLKPVEELPVEEAIVGNLKTLYAQKDDIVAKAESVTKSVIDTLGLQSPSVDDDDLFKRAQAVLYGD